MEINSAHVSYCSNIHSGESWSDHFAEISAYFPIIKSKISPDKPMGLGLRLSNAASLDLSNEAILVEFKNWLDDNEAYVFTINGFPYGNFHHAVVKDQVHAPDWLSADRVDYTKRLFAILAKLLPQGMEGGLSTSPLSYKHWFKTEAEKLSAKARATLNILAVVEYLILIRKSEGILMHLDIEPEPDGLLETGSEFINWFENDLLKTGIKYLQEKLNISAAEADIYLRDHVTLCYDVCHFAIGFEPHQEIIDTLVEKKIKIGKIQVSAAIKAEIPGNSMDREALNKVFKTFNEPTYLHQVIARGPEKNLRRYPDLPQALADLNSTTATEWRAHFHVPVFARNLGLVQSTQTDIVELLKIQTISPFSQHLEVETYTWEVLPENLKLPLDESIIRELNWVKNQLSL